MQTIEAEVAVIGGGIVGSATAYFLAKAGRKVVLLEKSDIGSEASGRNGGGVRQQGRDGPELPFAMASVKIWETLDEELGEETEYRQWGNIYVAATEERLQVLQEAWIRERAAGLPVEMLDHKGLEDVTGVRVGDVAGGKYNPTDGHANPILTTKAFGRAAARAGARILEQTPVTSIKAENGEIEAVLTRDLEVRVRTAVLATGPWSPEFGKQLGLDIPMRPVRNQLWVTERVPKLFRQFVIWGDPGGDAYWRPTVSGNMHIGHGGTADTDRETFSKATTLPVLNHMANATAKLFPDMANVRVIRSWSGTVELTPDHLPIIGPCSTVKGLIFATGFSGHGFCLGPISGKVVSDLITTGKSPLPLDDVSWERFEKGLVKDRGAMLL